MFLLGSGSGFQIFLDSVFSISNFLGELCPKLICDAVAFRIDAVCNKIDAVRNKIDAVRNKIDPESNRMMLLVTRMIRMTSLLL